MLPATATCSSMRSRDAISGPMSCSGLRDKVAASGAPIWMSNYATRSSPSAVPRRASMITTVPATMPVKLVPDRRDCSMRSVTGRRTASVRANRLGEKVEAVRELLAERVSLSARLDEAADAELGRDDLITTEGDPEVAVRLGPVAALLRWIEAVVTTGQKVVNSGAHRGRVVLGAERPAPHGGAPGGDDQPGVPVLAASVDGNHAQASRSSRAEFIGPRTASRHETHRCS